MLVRIAIAAVLLATSFAATAATASPVPVRPASILIRPSAPFPAVQITFDVPAPPTAFKLPAAPRTTVAEAPLASHPDGIVLFRVSF